ncbi:MAG: tetratricopeptide repeat protein [Tepidisphaeraceae bacterium]
MLALGERSQVLADKKEFVEARILLNQSLKLANGTLQEGEINYRSGYLSYQLGQLEESERSLRIARELFRGRHPMDADAAYLLGKIHQDRRQAEMAESFYKTVLTDYPESKTVPLAKLGLAMCRAARQDDAEAVAELTALAKSVDERPKLAPIRDDVLDGVRQAGGWMASRGNMQGALELMSLEQLLNPTPETPFFNRLADAFEARANQIESSLADAAPAERIKRQQQVRDMRRRAADAALAFSNRQTVADDKAYGESLWRGIELYERAGDTPAAIAALELFITERPTDPLTPDAVLRLGQAYRSVGQFDKAIAAYQKNQALYPKSIAASKSAVPLAQAYMSKGPESYGRAQQVLEAVIDNNPLIDPKSEEFASALFELGNLAYRSGKYEQAVTRLDEFAKRYPADSRMGQVLFLTADSYRKTAQC